MNVISRLCVKLGKGKASASWHISISHLRFQPQFHACLNQKSWPVTPYKLQSPPDHLCAHTDTLAHFPRNGISPSLNSRKLLCFSVVYLLIPISPRGNKRLGFTGVWDLLMGREMGCSLASLMPRWRSGRQGFTGPSAPTRTPFCPNAAKHDDKTPHTHSIVASKYQVRQKTILDFMENRTMAINVAVGYFWV